MTVHVWLFFMTTFCTEYGSSRTRYQTTRGFSGTTYLTARGSPRTRTPILTPEPGQQSVAKGDPDSPDVRHPPSTEASRRPRPASLPGGVEGVAARVPGSQLAHDVLQLQDGVLAVLAAADRAKQEGQRN